MPPWPSSVPSSYRSATRRVAPFGGIAGNATGCGISRPRSRAGTSRPAHVSPAVWSHGQQPAMGSWRSTTPAGLSRPRGQSRWIRLEGLVGESLALVERPIERRRRGKKVDRLAQWPTVERHSTDVLECGVSGASWATAKAPDRLGAPRSAPRQEPDNQPIYRVWEGTWTGSRCMKPPLPRLVSAGCEFGWSLMAGINSPDVRGDRIEDHERRESATAAHSV